MIENLEENLTGIAIGVRFRANFSIEDQIGRIIDQILYSKDSFFNPDIFPLVQSGIGKRQLANEETMDSLKIDNSNIILEINLGGSFNVADLETIHSKFEEQIIKGVLNSFKIKEIIRIGYIRRYIFQYKELAKKFVDKTIGETLGGINDINLRFSKKLPIEEAFVKKNLHDYYNSIFNIIKITDKEEIFMSVDFQRFYDPFLPNSMEIDFIPFIEKANSFNNKHYLPWLNNNYVEDK